MIVLLASVNTQFLVITYFSAKKIKNVLSHVYIYTIVSYLSPGRAIVLLRKRFEKNWGVF